MHGVTEVCLEKDRRGLECTLSEDSVLRSGMCLGTKISEFPCSAPRGLKVEVAVVVVMLL